MRVFLFLAAILGAVAVLAGAVGAHVWRDELLARNSLANFQLATDYLFYHALGIAVVWDWSPWLYYPPLAVIS